MVMIRMRSRNMGYSGAFVFQVPYGEAIVMAAILQYGHRSREE